MLIFLGFMLLLVCAGGGLKVTGSNTAVVFAFALWALVTIALIAAFVFVWLVERGAILQ